LILVCLFFYVIFLYNEGITFASTVQPSPYLVTDSPDPQAGGLPVNFTCDGCYGKAGAKIKLYVGDGSNCGIENIEPSLPFFDSSANVVESNPEETLVEDGINGSIEITDISNTQEEWGRWVWDFGSVYEGRFRINWYASVTGDAGGNVDVTVNISISLDGLNWIRVNDTHLTTSDTWLPYTKETVEGSYRYVKAEINSSTSGTADKAYLMVDVVRVDVENITTCYCNSSWVLEDPFCEFLCPAGCNLGTYTYLAKICADDFSCNDTVTWGDFHCLLENGCECTADTECFSNLCKDDYDGTGSFCCNADQCAHNGVCYNDGDCSEIYVCNGTIGEWVNHCNNNVQDCDETGVDIGGSCQTFGLELKPGWNLISIPNKTAERLASSTCPFPESRIRFYYFNSSVKKWEVKLVNELEGGKGYWIFNPSKSSCVLRIGATSPGSEISDIPPLHKGFNLIGGVDETSIPISSLSGCTIENNYLLEWNPILRKWVKSTELRNRTGYWIKVANDCKLST